MVESLGRYEIRRPLGHGAMGTVYEGWDPVLGRRVAIKTVRLPELPDSETQDALARFRREAQAAGRLTHPNIVALFDYGETNGLAYIVMEFVDGPPLKELLDKQERFALTDTLRVMKDLLAGLQFSHERGVAHRDIKPANLMLTSDGQVKIVDFGIARIESSSMTQAGALLGTPAYTSPEQFMGQVVDARTDIYSAGVLLYQLLTGEPPFEGDLSAIMHQVLHAEPPAPSQLLVTVPRAFDAVVRRAMAKRPEDRFPSALAFSAAMLAPFPDRVAAARVEPVRSTRKYRLPSPSQKAARQSPRDAGGPPPGAILSNIPNRMKVGRRERLEIRIGDAYTAMESLQAGLRGKGIPKIDRLEISPLMRVALTADPSNFSILALSTSDQHVRPAQVARWDFEVIPLRSGRHWLRVLASIRVKVRGKDEIVDLPSFEREVRVAVAPMRVTARFCSKNWQWLGGSIIIPVTVWAAAASGLIEIGRKYLLGLLK